MLSLRHQVAAPDLDLPGAQRFGELRAVQPGEFPHQRERVGRVAAVQGGFQQVVADHQSMELRVEGRLHQPDRVVQKAKLAQVAADALQQQHGGGLSGALQRLLVQRDTE